VLGGEEFIVSAKALESLGRIASWSSPDDVEILVHLIEQSKGLAENEDHQTLIEIAELVHASKEVDDYGNVVIALPLHLVPRVLQQDRDEEGTI
jgi:hypothetical protein